MNDKVSEYTFDDIEIGFSKKFQVIITESLVKQFASVSGDYSPIHMDEQYAKSTTFKKRVVHGMLLASFLSRVDGMYLPGKHALYFSQTVNFRSPCFVDDIVTVIGEVTEKRETTKMITVKTEIYNQNNICLINGIGKVIVRD